MEKFSAFRDPGTGIQPFLPPVPPSSSNILAHALLPLTLLVAILRSVILVLLLAVYALLVQGLCTILRPIPPLYRYATWFLTSILTRSALFVLGIFWIPVDHVSRKRGRGIKTAQNWQPKAGDLIVSNWVSWVEILWLAARFNPLFILPVFDPLPPHTIDNSDGIVTRTPGRRTGTGSANIASSMRTNTPRGNFLGFRTATLLEMLKLTGTVSPYGSTNGQPIISFEDIRRTAHRPIVVFPESTTSNGRGLLRFSNIFPSQRVPVKDFGVFVMCVRCDPPTDFSPSLSLAIPSRALNPLPHLFSVAKTLVPLTVSIRLLDQADSPSSPLFMVSEVAPDSTNDDAFVETTATLIAQLGKMKRTGVGWENKSRFFEFYQSRKS